MRPYSVPSTWKHFINFKPTAYERGLVKPIYHRIKGSWSSDALQSENFLGAALIRNSFPGEFVDVHSQQNPKDGPTYKAVKITIYIRLIFKTDGIPNDVHRKLNSAINCTFPTAHLHILSTIRRIIPNERIIFCFTLRKSVHLQNGPKSFTVDFRIN